MREALDPDLGAGLLLAGDVHGRRRVIADQGSWRDRGWACPTRTPRIDVRRHLRADLLRDRLTIDERGCHGTNSYRRTRRPVKLEATLRRRTRRSIDFILMIPGARWRRRCESRSSAPARRRRCCEHSAPSRCRSRWPGSWAGGGAIVGSDPLAVAADRRRIRLRRSMNCGRADAGRATPGASAVAGSAGWATGSAARIERVPPGPPRPVPMPEFHLAYYDNVLRQEPNGDWWFEALASQARRPELDRRHGSSARCSPAPAPAARRRRP